MHGWLVLCAALGLFGSARALATDAAAALAELEGVYEARLGSEPATLTIVRTAPDRVAVGIGTQYVRWGMTYSYFDAATGRLDASTYPRDQEPTASNYFVSLAPDGSGGLAGEFFSGAALRTLRAWRVDSYEDLLSVAEPLELPVSLVGRYQGVLDGRSFHLTIREDAQGLWGVGTFYPGEPTQFAVLFQTIHVSPGQGVVYLTSRQDSESFVHLRARLTRGELIGSYLIGGVAGERRLVLAQTSAMAIARALD